LESEEQRVGAAESGGPNARVVAFDNHAFDTKRDTLTYRGTAVHLEPRVAALLGYLIRHRERVVPRDELLGALWPGSRGTETALYYLVSTLRRALEGYEGRAVVMIRGQGYRFDVPVLEVHEAVEAPELVERTLEIKELRRMVRTCIESRRTQFLIVSGSAGIGKSRLVQELEAEWLKHGGRSLAERFGEGDSMPALWPFRLMLRELGPIAEAEALPELPIQRPDQPGSRADQYAYFADVRRFFEGHAARTPLLVLLEDIPLADDASLALLDFLVSGQRKYPLFYAVTCRTPLRQAVKSAIDELGRHAHTLALDPLSDAGSARLLRGYLTVAVEKSVERDVLHQAGGVPLFLREIALGLNTGARSVGDVLRAKAPSALLDSLRFHLSALEPSTRETLSVASVVGEQFDAALVAAGLLTNVATVLSRLTDAVKAQVLRPLSQLDFRFHHALFREYLYDALPEPERRILHYRIGTELKTLGGRAPDRRLSLVAHHLAEGATDAQQAAEAFEFGKRSAQASAERFAFALAVREIDRTLGLGDLAGIGARARVALLVAKADALRNVGDFFRAGQAATLAIELARGERDAAGLGDAVTALARIDIPDWGAEPRMIPLIEEVLAAVPVHERATRARPSALLAKALMFAPKSRRFEHCAEALRLAEGTDPSTQAIVLSARYMSHWGVLAHKQQWPAWIHECAGAASRAGEAEIELTAAWFEVLSELETGKIERSRDHAKEVVLQAERLGNQWVRFLAKVLDATLAIAREKPNAVELAGKAYEQGLPMLPNMAETVRFGHGVMFSFMTGPGPEWIPAAQAMLDSPARHPLVAAVLAFVHVRQGEREQAQCILELALDLARSFDEDNSALACLTLCAEVAAALGDRARSHELYERLLPFDGCLGMTGVAITILGLTGYALGRLAVTLGRFDAARAHFTAALDLATRLESPHWIRRCAAASQALAAGDTLEGWGLRACAP
jgi:DNA-binding winged helix-turn-helix (wHTH) protein